MTKVALILIWIAANPALVRHYDSVGACEKALDDATRDPGANGFCLPIAGPATIPDFRDGMRRVAGR
jgi:hypothetical protein